MVAMSRASAGASPTGERSLISLGLRRLLAGGAATHSYKLLSEYKKEEAAAGIVAISRASAGASPTGERSLISLGLRRL
jgi:hypothetical protein